MAPEATHGKAWWNWAWPPLLFAASPVLTLYNGNIAEVAPGEVIRPLLVMLAAVSLLWGLLALVLRNACKAALLCTFMLLLLFLYGIVRGLLLQSASPLLVDCGLDHAFLLRPWFGVLLLGLVLIVRTRRDLLAFSGPLTAVGATLVILPLFGIGKVLIPRLFQPALAPAAVAATEKAPIPTKDLPNIYYIILDGYAREDTLQRIFHYDNRPFLAHLEQQGFYIAGKSRSNYAQTDLSLPSSLNMAYLDAGREGSVPMLIAYLENNAVMRELRRHGYRFIAFDSEYHLQMKGVDRFIAFPQQNAWPLTGFEDLLLGLTPLNALPWSELFTSDTQDKTNPYEKHRQRIQFQLDSLPGTADRSRPVFVFAHILCPHPPFVLGNTPDEDPDRAYDIKDGSLYQMEGGTLEEYLTGYSRQVDRLNALLVKLTDRLLDSRRPTVIILQSDHGSGAYTYWGRPELTDFEERMANFCAIYTPGGPIPGLYDSITPVNIFRVLFNHYLKSDYPLLPDRSFFSTTGRPFDFMDVTDKVR
jgi:hypothetical protein